MSGSLPNFVIIGAQKSGTTSLYAYLRAHPEVSLAPGKEIHYFDRHLDEDLDWYKAKFAGATTEHAIGEATPDYMYFSEGLSRMAEVIPEARLIAILRNPVDRAYSHYWHERVRGREKLEFADAVAAEPARLATGERHAVRWYSYVDRGRYLAQLQRVCEFYPKEALQVPLFDDLCSAPLDTFHSVCWFLTIDDALVPPKLGEAFNRCTPAGPLKLRAISKRLRPLRRLVAKFNDRWPSYSPMDPKTRARLVEVFEEDNAALASWLGRDLTGRNK